MFKRSHIELFAGCGGMTLGLQSAGFNLLFANEISPMAGETFAYNILNEDLRELGSKNQISSNVLWLSSTYNKEQLLERLHEKPDAARQGKVFDINPDTILENKLLIGDIRALATSLIANPRFISKYQNIDILSGGPPCQGFSLAGKREKDDKKNSLPLVFAKIAGLLKPKIVILENVPGITLPFSVEGKKHEAWLEVSKAFAIEDYIPLCFMVNTKYFRIPQNRSRFILLGFRKDIFRQIQRAFQEPDFSFFLNLSNSFHKKVHENINNLDYITKRDFALIDIESFKHLFNGYLLPEITSSENNFISAEKAIGDISNPNTQYFLSNIDTEYTRMLNGVFSKKIPSDSVLQNHEPRNHSQFVKSRFRLYQVVNELQNGHKPEAIRIIKGQNALTKLNRYLIEELLDHKLLFYNSKGKEKLRHPRNFSEIKMYLESLPTKKHSQRALKLNELAPSQLTVPDDVCHYDINHLRTMTVRETARFQSFPDWFVFKAKATTGHILRKFEVPQYSQVGNAVPPLLAKVLGDTVLNILERIGE